MIQIGEEQAQLEEYRLRNRQLRKKLREKDIKIMQLFDCIDQTASRLAASTPHSQITNHAQSPQPYPHTKKQRNAKIVYSQSKKEKELSLDRNHDSSNIFKQQSVSFMGKESRVQLRLPALEKRRKLEFAYPMQDSILENPEGRAKIVRIPIDRLKPLNSKEVKKRFLMKFQRKEEDSQKP